MDNEIIIKDESQLALRKSKRLLGITKKVLSNSSVAHESWIEKLWNWADANKIDDYKHITTNNWRDYFGQDFPKYLLPNHDFYIGIPRDLDKLLNVTELFLINYDLDALPAELFKLTKLRTLNLDLNNLLDLTDDLAHLVNLEVLSAFGNQLLSISPEIGKLTKLSKLNLEFNNLTELSPEIDKLINLKKLVLGNNDLEEIPSKIGNLQLLSELQLNHNSLSGTLPASIWKLHKLTELDLQFNDYFDDFSPEIKNLISLEKLFLTDTECFFPRELDGLKKLRSLWVNSDFWNCDIPVIPKNCTLDTSKTEIVRWTEADSLKNRMKRV